VTIEEHANEFAGLPVQDYDPDEGIKDPESHAYRLSISYDASTSGETMTGLLAGLVEDPAAFRLRALIIGAWEDVYDPNSGSGRVVEALVASSAKLPRLRALFLGDVIREEAEISWIQQSDVTSLFDAFPRLEQFRVRGGSGLVIGSLRHQGLQSLIVESGGLDAAVVRGIASSDLPRLEHLELWIGSEDYGKTTGVADLAPILRGDVFPALRYLGLRNGEGADELAAAVAAAPILERIKVLDFSLGNLGDEGAKALAASPAVARLEKLDFHHHYVSPAVVAAIEALGIEIDASDVQEPDRYTDEEHRYIAVSE
jgi:hypothetical protein